MKLFKILVALISLAFLTAIFASNSTTAYAVCRRFASNLKR